MKELRNARWEKAFSTGCGSNTGSLVEENPKDAMNRKATIVIEHSKFCWSHSGDVLFHEVCSYATTPFLCAKVIQASDISHTMQHWHVYRKWNQNLFEELYVAYLNGRMEKNPAEFWFKGEFGKWSPQ